jgi:cytochrome P450
MIKTGNPTPGYTPGPGGNPLDQLRAFEASPLEFLDEVSRNYGDVVRLRFWPELYHLISDPEAVRRVLVTEADRYHSIPSPARSAPATDGAARANDHISPADRFHQLARGVFHGSEGVSSMVPEMTSTIDSWMSRWEPTNDDRRAVDIADEMSKLTLAVLGRAVLRIDATTEVHALAEAFRVGATVGSLQHSVSVYQALEQAGRPADRELAAAQAVIDAFVQQTIEVRRRSGHEGSDLLTRLVFDPDTDDPDRLRDDQEVRDVISVLLIAGHSAVASALTWTFHLLARHPAVRARLEREVDTVLGRRRPTADDLRDLRYTRMVLLESMRLFPPVWLLLPRRVSTADRIGGHAMPAGSKIAISPWVLHHHPALWPRPTVFDPERFARPEPRAYLPFGAGPWACVGAQFGLTEARLVVAMAVQRYRWHAPPGPPPVADPQVALWPRDGLAVSFEVRNAR